MEDTPAPRETSPAILALIGAVRAIQDRLRLSDEPSQFRPMLEEATAPPDKAPERR